MERSETIRPPKRPAPGPATSDRFQARMERQKILEHEQRMEDLEALKVTAEEIRTLQESFAAVKTEFADLDGQSWDTPAAREMLVNWHAQQATQERPVYMSPGGLRMRHQQPRRSLAAVVSPAASIGTIPTAEDEDVFVDETVRGRPVKVSPARIVSTVEGDCPPGLGLVRMRREGTMASATADVDEDSDAATTLQASAGLGAPSRSMAGFEPPDPSTKRRLYDHLAKLATQNNPAFAHPASSAPMFTSAGWTASRLVSQTTTSVLSTEKAVPSNSPTLNQSSTFSTGLAPVSPVTARHPQALAGCSTIVANSAVVPEDVKIALHEFFPGIQINVLALGSAPPYAISAPTRQPASPRLTPSGSAANGRRRARGRTLVRVASGSPRWAGVPVSCGREHYVRKVAEADDDDDVDGEDDLGGVPLVRTISSTGWSPHGSDD